MSVLSVQQLGKYYGAQDIFAGLDFSIARGDKIALVGPNGAGKTTLLRILVGAEEPSQGTVQRARGLRIGYLPQRPELVSEHTLYDEMLAVFDDLRRKQQELLALADEMATAHDSTELLERYAEAEQRFDLAGGYDYENRIKRVLSGLGFGPETYDWPIAVLSGGQVTRASLARLLLQEPGLLILDEPTNYLDLAALEWLESYLQDWPHSLLIVSHDRYFLDKVVSRVWEMNHGVIEYYRGNYTSYVAQRAARLERRQREYEEQQETIADTEEFIRRYKAGQRSKEAKGRETRLNRLERIEAPQHDRRLRLRMSAALRSGDNVLMSENALIGYTTRPDAVLENGPTEEFRLLETGEFLIERGHRVALLGPNGSGKTTLLRTILGELEPLAGRIRLGASIRLGYLPQTQDWLDPDKTVLEQVQAVSNLELEPARHLLGRFLFSGDDVFKLVGTLSGGERARLALAIVTLRGPNVLLLDEPTTHLDIASQEALQDVLTAFTGTILFVSHDRYLIDALATHVWMVEAGNIRKFEGNYSDYVEAMAREKAAALQAEQRATENRERDERRERERLAQRAARRRSERLEKIEAEIEQYEQQLMTLTQLIDLASSQRNVERVQALSREYQQAEAALAQRLDEWESCASLTAEEG